MARYCLFVITFFLCLPRVHCQDRTEEARILFMVHDSAKKAGDFKLAREKLDEILKEDYRLTDLYMAAVHNALGWINYEMGKTDQAEYQYDLAESYCDRAGPSSTRVRLQILNNRAVLYNSKGDYTIALDHYNRAIYLLDSLPDRNLDYMKSLTMLQLNQGIALYRTGRYNEARERLEQSERLKKDHNLPYLGSVYLNLARVSRELGEPETAAVYYRESIGRWTVEFDSGYYQLANLYLEYGRLLGSMGQVRGAEQYLEAALRNYMENFGGSHHLTAACYEQTAAFFLDQGDYLHALDLLGRAMSSISPGFRATGLPDNPDAGSSLHELTFLKILVCKTRALEYAAGKQAGEPGRGDYLHAAIASNRRGIEVLYRLQGSYLSGESRTYLISHQKELFETGIRLNLGMHDLTRDDRYLEEAFLVASRGKSNELLYEMKIKEWLYLETMPDTAARTVIRLNQLTAFYSNLIESGRNEPEPDTARLTEWEQQLFLVRDSFAEQMDLLRSGNPHMARSDSPGGDLSIRKIRKNMGRRESLVEYFISGKDEREDLYIFVVTRKQCHSYHERLDSTFHHHLDIIGKHLYGFVPFRENPLAWEELKQSLFGLYNLLVDPVEHYFRGNELTVVPDGELSYIPFDALITRYEPDRYTDYSMAPYMLQDYEISYLVNSQLEPGGFGRTRFPRVLAVIPGYNAGSREGSREGSLAGAAGEVEEILQVTGGQKLTGNPGKNEVINLLGQAGIVHMAMHARSGQEKGESPHFYFPRENVTTGPGTAAGDLPGSGSEDGDSRFYYRLYDFEIGAMNLSTPLVVLSSCESAAGELVQGEGIMSLSRSFLQGGAGSVVHSLWKVEDLRGGKLMPEFYRQLKKGLAKNRALATAKRMFLESGNTYDHPYYWASYQLTGDTAPVASGGKNKLWFLGLLILPGLYFLTRRIFSPSSRASSPYRPE